MDQDLSAPAIAILAVLAICFVAIVLLVVSLPGVKKLFQRTSHTPGEHGPEGSHLHPPGLHP